MNGITNPFGEVRKLVVVDEEMLPRLGDREIDRRAVARTDLERLEAARRVRRVTADADDVEDRTDDVERRHAGTGVHEVDTHST